VVLLGLAACGDNLGAPGPRGIVVSPQTLQLRVGDTAQAAARYQTRGEDLAAADVAWSSSDPSRATVSGEGAEVTITAVAPGDVTITAAGRGVTGTLALSVSPAEVLRISVAP